jgi:glycerophosphoryl diester phosphodiesterase
MLDHVHVIAHRGASAYAPENTRSAFIRAEVLGAGCIEFDVQLSADGELFVFHDDTLNRTTNGRGAFALASSEQLRQLDAGSWFSSRYKKEPLLSFKEALLWFSTRSIKANIEVKAPKERIEETTLAVLREINRHWPMSKPLPLVSSFELEALRLCANLIPDLPLGLLLSTWRDDCLTLAREIGCVAVNLSRRYVTRERVALLKDADYTVCVYTVNSRSEAQRYLTWGVDAVFSDYPDLLTKPSRMQMFLKKIWIKRQESPKIIE